jgi:hypothetical protein
MTILCNPIVGSEVEDIDGEISHLGDFIEDTITTSLPAAKMSVEQQEAEFLRSMREWPGPGPQLTGEGWRMLIRAAEREKAAFRTAAIEKYGAVLVHAAERWARSRHPEVAYYLGKVDPYEWWIRIYRGVSPGHVGVRSASSMEVGDDAVDPAGGNRAHAAGHRAPARYALEAVCGCLPAGGPA